MSRRTVDSQDNQITINFGLINKNRIYRDQKVSKLPWIVLIVGIGLFWYFHSCEKK